MRVAPFAHMPASTTMTRDVIVVPPELSLADAWAIMQREHIRHLPVVKAGALLGIVSDRDVLLRASMSTAGLPVLDTRELVATAMTPAPFVCPVTTSVGELVKLMTEKRIDAIPVVSSSERLVGLVTTTDLLQLLDGTRPPPFEFKIHEAAIPKS